MSYVKEETGKNIDVEADVDLLYRGKAPKQMTRADTNRIVSAALASLTPVRGELHVTDKRVVLRKYVKKEKKKRSIFKVKPKNIAQYRDVPEADQLMMIRHMKMGRQKVLIIRFKTHESFINTKQALKVIAFCHFRF